MNDDSIKLSSYYIIFNDETGGCSVRFYDKSGDIVRKFYYSWDECLDKEELKRSLDNQLDPSHKWQMRPRLIKIYESNLGRTIGFYDKNDNLVYYSRYEGGGSSIDDILESDLSNAPIDFKYLEQTKNALLQNSYDGFINQYSKVFSHYWNNITKYF